jgi:triphosphoribosyl-dephospho-CoA synthase
MTSPLPRAKIEGAFVAACQAELDVLKPGNVHRFQGGHHMSVAQFEQAASAAAPHVSNPDLEVGQRILVATRASFAATGVNTNLGIVLLCVPLAKAAAETGVGIGLRRRLAVILSLLTVADARHAFAAIRLANPAGLGEVDKGDVSHDGPDMTLIEAMHLAAGRDRIANAYVTAFEDIFDFALPAYRDALRQASTPDLAVTTLHMTLLAEFPDSHLARKFGTDRALEIRDEARRLKPHWAPAASAASRLPLLAFDRELKARGFNPGTTADFVVATLFASLISGRKGT